MPQEHKKRGRRMKRKHDDGEDPVPDPNTKRRKSTEDFDVAHQHDFVPDAVDGHDYDASLDTARPGEKPFFGMLDEEEQTYFKGADDMLEMNDFGDDEERNLFLANVYREADGKELKVAQSQSCSRLTERLIQLSTPSQLKSLFQKFSGK